MSRRRPVLSNAEWNEMANETVSNLNTAISAANLVHRQRSRERVRTFLEMALGSMEVTDLIAEYQRLLAEMNQVQVKFKRLMGGSANLNEYLPGAREALLDRVVRSDPGLPLELRETMEFLLRQHGIEVETVTDMPMLGTSELIERLRRCETVEEGQTVLKGYNLKHSILIAKFAKGEL